MSSYVKSGVSSDIGFEVQGAFRNITGNGDTVKVSSTNTKAGAKEMLTTYSYPNIKNNYFTGNLVLSAKSGEEDQSYFTAYKKKSNSISAEYVSNDNVHSISAEYALRDEIPMHNMKSSTSPKPGK